jgi:Tol biopolymer transport system component
VVFSLETGEKRCLTAPPLYSEVGDSEPALSPDGKTVAFQRNTTAGPASVYTVTLSGGNPRKVTPDNWAAWNPKWSSDGQHIIFVSPRTGLNRVWRVPATGGASELETVYPATGTLSRDGWRLAYVEPSWFWPSRAVMISRIELSSAGGQVVSQNGIIASDGGNQSAQPSPDRRQIVFQSGRTTRPEIWKSDADGSHRLQKLRPTIYSFIFNKLEETTWNPFERDDILFCLLLDPFARI